MIVPAIAAGGVLLLELALTGVSALIGLDAWRARIRTLVRIEVGPSARAAVVGFCILAFGLIAGGFAAPPLLAAGGALCAAAAASVLGRQWSAGDRGTSLGSYSFFCACGVALLASAV